MDSEGMGVMENKDGGIQRSELLLNTMKVERKCIVGNERSDEESVWSECPDHILEKLFSTLDMEFSSRFRIVCKEWNTLLSSNRFLSLIPQRAPWILLCSATHAMAYCFFTQAWKTISFSFLPGYSKFCTVSGAGLLLFNIKDPWEYSMICNPLTSKYTQIPAIVAEKLRVRAIIDDDGDDGRSYKFVGLPRDGNSNFVHIYSYFEMSWQIEEEFSVHIGDFDIKKICCAEGFVVCDLNFFLIMIYDMEAQLAHLVLIPERCRSILGDNMENPYEVVLCGSSILFVVGYLEFNQESLVNSHVIVWELFQEEEEGSIRKWNWREVTRMPADMCRKLIKAACPDELELFSELHFIGVGNFLCLGGWNRNTKLFVYSLQERCWSRIRLPLSVRFNRYNRIFSFQPKPGMMV